MNCILGVIMILEIEDYNGERLGALRIHENSINDNIEIINKLGDISICDIDFDNIFSSNEHKMRISLEKVHNYDSISDSIVEDIITCRRGEMYDEEILDMFVNDFYENKMEIIRMLVDEKMSNHLDNDNLTII